MTASRAASVGSPSASTRCAVRTLCGTRTTSAEYSKTLEADVRRHGGRYAEAAHAAVRSGVDLRLFRKVLEAGPMASAVSRAKLQKLVDGDFGAQAAIRDVAVIAELVRQQARAAGAETPLIDVVTRLYAAADRRGLSDLDMVALLNGTPRPTDRA